MYKLYEDYLMRIDDKVLILIDIINNTPVNILIFYYMCI